MTIDIDEKLLAASLDGMKRIAEVKESSGNPYGRTYSDYLKAYSDIGLYISFSNGHHTVAKSAEL